MDLLIGLDVGTSAVKGVLVSAEGEQIHRAMRGTVFLEVEPEAHYRAVCDLIAGLASHAPGDGRVRGMAVAGGNTLLLDETDAPLTNIINWMDQRAAGNSYPGFTMDHAHGIVGRPFLSNDPIEG